VHINRAGEAPMHPVRSLDLFIEMRSLQSLDFRRNKDSPKWTAWTCAEVALDGRDVPLAVTL